MTTDAKTPKRLCLKCRQEKEIYHFAATQSPFFPGHRSLICISCLEIMVPPEEFNQIDRLCRYLDIPFDIDEWTQLYETHKEHTLTAYLEMMRDERYEAISWQEENERWRLAREQKTIDEEIEVLSKAKTKELTKRWSAEYTAPELLFLENYYNRILATQNVSTPILQEYAKDLCEIELRIKKGLRAGEDVKKDMDARDNIIKIAKFDAQNSKSAADFESIGELMVYYGKKGWHPEWHQEPQDSVDFCMKNVQAYLQRLVTNEGNFLEQVEDKREKFNTIQRIEDIEDEGFEVASAEIEYEEEDEELR